VDEFLTPLHDAGAKPLHVERVVRAWLAGRSVETGSSPPQSQLSARVRALLPELEARLERVAQVVSEHPSADGSCRMLVRLADGATIETVLLPRNAQCVSTQVGCAVGCTFCLTATAGLTRNLTAAEMVLQILGAERIAGMRPRNLVLMGMGEPLHNYDEVARFLAIVTDPKGMAFSPNRVTLSTAGLVPAIRRLLEDDLPCNLAVSLNATTDAVRSQIMPINRKYPLAELLETIRDYVRMRGGKRVLIEYVMLAGINDSLADAERLCALLAGIDSTVNLLPFNEFPGNPYTRPSDAQVSAFRQVLVDHSLVAVVRESRGRDISAACGQLRTEVMQRRRSA
jgi:23S rRNA (adenine2503-C2)-methyltransferase